jgi:hypothetical protein
MAEQEISPAFHPSSLSRDELVVYYSLRRLRIREIQSFPQEVHGYCISERHLIRLRKKYGVCKRGHESPISDVASALQRELQGPGNLLGYRCMWTRLNHSHGLSVRRDTVMALLSVEGTQSRKMRRLRRRLYRSKGPNFIWHMDGIEAFWYCNSWLHRWVFTPHNVGSSFQVQ